MVFCAGFWDTRRIWPSEMKGRTFWPRKQLVQMPREKREQALSWVWIHGEGCARIAWGLLSSFSTDDRSESVVFTLCFLIS